MKNPICKYENLSFPDVDDLTCGEINTIFSLFLDTKLERVIERDPDRIWMLNYLYDSKLREKFVQEHSDVQLQVSMV